MIVPWVEDSKLIAGLGESGLTGNIYSGFSQYEDMLFLLHALHPNEIFVDVGANAGAYTVLASAVVGSKSISFEPLPETSERLRDQVQINHINDLVCIKSIGVSDQKGMLFFTNNNDTTNKVCLAGCSENVTKVAVTTLDDELEKNIDYFFKIDVEGFEFNVIKGGENILSSPKTSALIIELNSNAEEFGHSKEDIHNKLIDLNFKAVTYNPITRLLKEINTYNANGDNTIYVKDIKSMAARCKVAPKRCVHTVNGVYI
jgi:FkbM family methyltransferase